MTLNTFDISYIVPITQKFTPLKVLYNSQIIYEYIVMPWETGISKSFNFTADIKDEKIQVHQLSLVDCIHGKNILLETLKVNNKVKNVSKCSQPKTKKIMLSSFFKAIDIEPTVIKIIGLNEHIHLSHSYMCNGNLYVPKCDKDKSIITVQDRDDLDFSFSVEFFSDNLMKALSRMDCRYKDGYLETNILNLSSTKDHNIIQLHEHLRKNYSFKDEEFKDEKPKTKRKKSNNVSSLSRFTNKNNTKKYTHLLEKNIDFKVLKIEGLPENLLGSCSNILYEKGAYYLSFSDKELFYQLMDNVSQEILVTLSYYGDDTKSPIIRKTLTADSKTGQLKKIA